MIRRSRAAIDAEWRKRPMNAIAFYSLVFLAGATILTGAAAHLLPVGAAGLLILVMAVYARSRTLIAQNRAPEGEE